ncbi:related to salicylate 1-monooxygenase [Rhynchosporium graminicola]|uniref:Related to salicylate 1-monooxygenase n=1 Tax=Rhynchosporium graminicola TaxID=2792576 RepID=A0A1E1KFA8_9HELO|nr:related to salicylate 1-monooxygenase [Rhynchosporium commune]
MATNNHQCFEVAIVGAGIAGLALAMALHKKGISFTLYEGAKEYSAAGAGIGFAPNGMRAMDLINPGFRPFYDQICVGNRGEDAQHIFFEGMLLEEGLGCDQLWYGNSSWGHPNYMRKSAHRKALLDIMTRFIPIENVKFNKQLTDIEEHQDGVTLRFVDGSSADAGVLAGCDGIKSMVREYVLGGLHPSQVAPVYAGAYCYRSVVPISEAYEIFGDLTDIAKFYFGHKRGAVTYRISSGKEFNFLLCVADSLDAWRLKDAVTEKVPYENMMADFEDPTIDDKFRQLLRKAEPVKWGLFHHPHTATYFRGRVVLIGDSAHASLPFQAAGASQGVEDALVLSNVLEKLVQFPDRGESHLPQIREGFAAYDSVRRPRAQKQLDNAAEVSNMLFFQHAETGDNMEKILPRLQEGWFDWLWFHYVGVDVQEVLRRMK